MILANESFYNNTTWIFMNKCFSLQDILLRIESLFDVFDKYLEWFYKWFYSVYFRH